MRTEEYVQPVTHYLLQGGNTKTSVPAKCPLFLPSSSMGKFCVQRTKSSGTTVDPLSASICIKVHLHQWTIHLHYTCNPPFPCTQKKAFGQIQNKQIIQFLRNLRTFYTSPLIIKNVISLSWMNVSQSTGINCIVYYLWRICGITHVEGEKQLWKHHKPPRNKYSYWRCWMEICWETQMFTKNNQSQNYVQYTLNSPSQWMQEQAQKTKKQLINWKKIMLLWSSIHHAFS